LSTSLSSNPYPQEEYIDRLKLIKALCTQAWGLIYARFNKANMEEFLQKTENLMIMEFFLAIALFYQEEVVKQNQTLSAKQAKWKSKQQDKKRGGHKLAPDFIQ
jgi:hypothetical protein